MKNVLIWCNTKEKLKNVVQKLKGDGFSTAEAERIWESCGAESVLNVHTKYKNITYCSKDWYEKRDYATPITADKFLGKSKNPAIVIFRRDRNVIAKNVATGDEGVAKCSPNDDFVFKTGAAIAMARLMAKTPEVLTDDVKAEWKKVLGLTPVEKRVYTDVDRNFNVGDRVVVRDWDDMAKEYGVYDGSGTIKCPNGFTKTMRHLCGRTATVKYVNGISISVDFDDESGNTYWSYAKYMFNPINSGRPTPKFKVGDLVTLKSDAKSGKMYDGVILIDAMIEKLKCKSRAVSEVHVKDVLITYTLMNRYIYSESMLEKCEESKIYEGDKVRIKEGCTGMRYDLHHDWVKEYISDPDLLIAFERENHIDTSLDYEVVKIAPHGVQSKTLAYIKYEGYFRTVCYLFDIKALEKV